VRAVRFGRAPWRRGLDPDEVYELLDWVADELDLRAREVASALAEADRVKEALRRWQTRNARTGWSTLASGAAYGRASAGGEAAGGRISDELATHYQETLIAHADEPSLGACVRCRRSRCAEWRWAYERLVVAGRLGDLPS
jgi:DivIVA domain-containing protein